MTLIFCHAISPLSDTDWISGLTMSTVDPSWLIHIRHRLSSDHSSRCWPDSDQPWSSRSGVKMECRHLGLLASSIVRAAIWLWKPGTTWCVASTRKSPSTRPPGSICPFAGVDWDDLHVLVPEGMNTSMTIRLPGREDGTGRISGANILFGNLPGG